MEVEVESIDSSASTAPITPSEPAQIRPLEKPLPVAAPAPPAILTPLETSETSVYLQLGAFKSQQSAESFMERIRNDLGDLGKQFKLSVKDGLVRVHIGPMETRVKRAQVPREWGARWVSERPPVHGG